MLRFVHFTSLTLAFGFVMYGAQPVPLTTCRLLTKRFLRLQQHAVVWSLVGATTMFVIQGGLMRTGWSNVFSPDIWLAVLRAQFGGVRLQQTVLALVTLIVTLTQPRNVPRLLFMPTTAQFILLAGVGRAMLNGGVATKIHQTSYTIHLICAAAWFEGLLPVPWYMRLIKSRWRHQATQALAHFSWCEHFAVIDVLASGVLNALLITGFPPTLTTYWGQLLLFKAILAMVIVVIMLANRYVLVPRMRQDGDRTAPWLVWTTKLEWVIDAVVLVTISLSVILESS